MIDFKVAMDKLAGFQSAVEIAEYFQSEGIRGARLAHTSCPIAKWTEAQTGNVACVTGPTVWNFSSDSEVDRDRFECTRPMMNFVAQFDSGQYPELEEKGWWA